MAGGLGKWAILNPRTGQILSTGASEAAAWRDALEEWDKMGLRREEIGIGFCAAHAGKGFEWGIGFEGLIWVAKLERKGG